MASSSTLLCPGTLLLCRAQPQPCKEQCGQGSNEGPHHSGFAVEVRRKHVPTVLASARHELPATAKQAGGPGSGEHPLVLSHTIADWLRWDGTSGDGPVQPPAQARMLMAVFLNPSEDGGSTASLGSLLQHCSL